MHPLLTSLWIILMTRFYCAFIGFSESQYALLGLMQFVSELVNISGLPWYRCVHNLASPRTPSRTVMSLLEWVAETLDSESPLVQN